MSVETDLFSDDMLGDPYPAYRLLRDQAEAVKVQPLGAWVAHDTRLRGLY